MIGEKDMGAAERIKTIARDKKVQTADMAEHLGLATQTLYNKMCRNTMKYNDVEALADYLDCDIVFKDRKTGKEY